MRRFVYYLFLSMSCVSLTAWAEHPDAMKEDQNHVSVWNRFMDQALELHKKQIAQGGVKKSSKISGYANNPKFYVEERYHHKEDGRLLSVVQWERENPQQLHAIEVYVHDDKGRVIRDYMGAYLPHYRNAPTQTLASLHGYNAKLHAFRTFDASGERIFERCQGQYWGKEVNIRLDLDDIELMKDDKKSLMYSRAYKKCFKGIEKEAGVYLQPQ